MRSLVRGIAMFLAWFALAGWAAWIIVGIFTMTSDLQNDLTNIGFSQVQTISSVSGKTTATVQGCKLGFGRDDTGDSWRIIGGHKIYPYNVSVVGTNDTWTAIPEMANKASTLDEVTAYLSAHRDKYQCYKP